MTDTTIDAEQEKPKAQKCRATGQLMLALIMTFGFFGMIVLAMFIVIPKENHDIIMALMGVMATLMNITWAFYFASSIGSRSKDEAMSNVVSKLAPTGTGDGNTATANVTLATEKTGA